MKEKSAHEKNVENLIKMHVVHTHRHAQYYGMFMKYGPWIFDGFLELMWYHHHRHRCFDAAEAKWRTRT